MLSEEKCTTHCCFALFHSVDFNSAIDVQESIAFRYPADLSLSAMIAVCGTIQTFTVAAFMERDASAWKIHRKGSLQLVAILYGVRTLPAYLVFFFFFLYTPRDHVRRESLLRGCHTLEESGAYTGKAPSSRRHSPRCWWSSRSSSTRSSWEAPPTLEGSVESLLPV